MPPSHGCVATGKGRVPSDLYTCVDTVVTPFLVRPSGTNVAVVPLASPLPPYFAPKSSFGDGKAGKKAAVAEFDNECNNASIQVCCVVLACLLASCGDTTVCLCVSRLRCFLCDAQFFRVGSLGLLFFRPRLPRWLCVSSEDLTAVNRVESMVSPQQQLYLHALLLTRGLLSLLVVTDTPMALDGFNGGSTASSVPLTKLGVMIKQREDAQRAARQRELNGGDTPPPPDDDDDDRSYRREDSVASGMASGFAGGGPVGDNGGGALSLASLGSMSLESIEALAATGVASPKRLQIVSRAARLGREWRSSAARAAAWARVCDVLLAWKEQGFRCVTVTVLGGIRIHSRLCKTSCRERRYIGWQRCRLLLSVSWWQCDRGRSRGDVGSDGVSTPCCACWWPCHRYSQRLTPRDRMLPPTASLRELVLLTCGHPNSVTSQLSDTRSAVSLQQVVVGPLVPTLSPVSLTREGTAGRLTFKHTPLTVVPRSKPAPVNPTLVPHHNHTCTCTCSRHANPCAHPAATVCC